MTRGKVLVVDDEEKIRSLLKLYFIENEYDVLLASSGKSALEVMRQQRPDVIVLDILLPDLNGIELCQLIRKEADIPVIYLSCLQESETIITGLEIGGDDYLTKPCDPNVLIAKVNALLRRTKEKEITEKRNNDMLLDSLSAQEVQILQWIEKGYTNKEIANKLKLKEGTIKVYNNTIFQKLHVKNRTQAIVRAKEEGVI